MADFRALRRGLWAGFLLSILAAGVIIFVRGVGVADDSEYWTIGRELGRGAVLYRDVEEVKPPLLFWTAQFTHTLWGDNLWFQRGFIFLVFLSVLALLYFHLGKRPLADDLSRPALLTVSAVSLVFTQAYSLHLEPFGVLFVLAAYGVLDSTALKSAQRFFLFGIFLSAACGFKQLFFIFFVAEALYRGAMRSAPSSESYAEFIGISLAGFFAVLGGQSCLLWAQGGLSAARENILLFPRSFNPFSHSFSNGASWLKTVLAVPLFLPAVLLIFLEARVLTDSKNIKWAAVLAVVSAVVFLRPSRHLASLLNVPAFFLIAAVCREKGMRARVRGVLVAASVIGVIAVSALGFYFYRHSPLKSHLEFRREVMDQLEKHGPVANVFVFAKLQPRYYYLINRRPYGKHYFIYDMQAHRVLWRDLFDAVRGARPDAIVVERQEREKGIYNPALPVGLPGNFIGYDQIDSFLAGGYRKMDIHSSFADEPEKKIQLFLKNV